MPPLLYRKKGAVSRKRAGAPPGRAAFRPEVRRPVRAGKPKAAAVRRAQRAKQGFKAPRKYRGRQIYCVKIIAFTQIAQEMTARHGGSKPPRARRAWKFHAFDAAPPPQRSEAQAAKVPAHFLL